MRKTQLVTLVLMIGGAIALAVVLGGPLNSEQRLVNQLSIDFMEDLQFKDFRRSASYHHKLERDRVDVGQTLEKLFLVKPEGLDIQNYRIVKAETDSTGDRARVHLRTRFQRLNITEKPEDGEVILYWMKRNPDCPIGATCADGACLNPAGEVLYFAHDSNKPIREEEAEKQKKTAEERKDPVPTKLSCEVGAEPRWFMNLDSTLKEKRYNY